jgi:hypothetical protein
MGKWPTIPNRIPDTLGETALFGAEACALPANREGNGKRDYHKLGIVP